MQVHCKYDALVPVGELKPHPKNRNSHPPEQIARLAKLLAYQGLRAPIVVSSLSGCIVKGHGTLSAIKENGWIEAPVVYQAFTDEAQEYAFVQSDNAISLWAELDLSGINTDIGDLGPEFDIDLLGIKGFEIEVADKHEGDPDEVPEAPVEPKTKRGDMYRLGQHRLTCGDSTLVDDVTRLMGEDKADCMWTDPPYNIAYEGGSKKRDAIENDEMSGESFYEFLHQVFSNALMFAKGGAPAYVAHADSEGINFRSAFKDSGWLLKQCLIWAKQRASFGRSDYHWKHEPILYGWAPGAAHTWLGDRTQTTILEFDRPQRSDEHPTMKPVDLVEYCLAQSCPSGGIVVDLFGGSGTTLIAAERMGIGARIMELDPKYCDVIVARWEKYTGKKAELISG